MVKNSKLIVKIQCRYAWSREQGIIIFSTQGSVLLEECPVELKVVGKNDVQLALG
jgi:hypothetical protein